MWRSTRPETGISYRLDYAEKLDKTLGFDVLDKSILACYRDSELLWTAEFPDLYVEGSVHTSAGTAVWGYNDTWSSEQPKYSCVARVDESGNILWQKQLEHGFEREYIAAVVDNGDGTWAVFSRGDFRHLCLSQYDMDGNELFNYDAEVGNLGIWNVVCLGDGYLVQLGNTTDGETARLVKLSRDGGTLDTFIYEGEDCDYTITDMIEFGGRVYLSAYAVPKQTDRGGRYEIADILAYLFDNNIWEISSEELTPMVPWVESWPSITPENWCGTWRAWWTPSFPPLPAPSPSAAPARCSDIPLMRPEPCSAKRTQAKQYRIVDNTYAICLCMHRMAFWLCGAFHLPSVFRVSVHDTYFQLSVPL